MTQCRGNCIRISIMERKSLLIQILTIILSINSTPVYSDGEGCGGPASSIIATRENGSCGYIGTGKSNTLVTSFGAPIQSLTASLTVGPKGPILLQDAVFIDEIQHFVRERIPDRVVHAKGAGAFGYFEVTGDITKYTKAALFSKIGQRTAIAARFSTIVGEIGSPDTIREPRGFAVKFYTQEGIWDIAGFNTPISFIRDPILFPSLIHSQKRNPVTNLKDPNMVWDFFSLRPETIYQVIYISSDAGIPDGYRHMEGHAIHSYKLVNKIGETVWAKFHFLPNQGIKNLPSNVAAKLAGSDPDYATRDLYNAIANKIYPTWTMYIQIMTDTQTKLYNYAFDVTKEWPVSEFPFIEVGKMVLNRNPTNYFADIEQIAFAVRNLVPGIEPSPDKLFLGRMLAYSDTQHHRLGPNHLQLPVNCPYRVSITNYQRDGPQVFYNQQGAPNYYPNTFGGPQPSPKGKLAPFHVAGIVDRYDSGDEDNFSQPGQFWRNKLNESERIRVVQNIADSLKDANPSIQARALKNFYQVDNNLGNRLRDALQKKEDTEF